MLDNFVEEDLINKKIKKCGHSDYLLIQSYPVSYNKLVNILNYKIADVDNKCISLIQDISNDISENYDKSLLKLGYQSKVRSTYFQTIGKRFYENENIYFSYSDTISDFAYKINITNDLLKNDYFFDESYLSYKFSNNIISVGRISRWWSPSKKSSLILSNSARPSYGFELKNYAPIKPKNYFLSFLGEVDYEFFLNRLEKNRTIPNTLLFGNRVSIKPMKNLNISLVRLAQFGGKGRSVDSSTIINMLIGRDNYSRKNINEQPGNQIAGIDFSYNPKINKNIRLYGQVVGEDEAGYLPSRTMSLLGADFHSEFFKNPTTISVEYVDTFSGKENYSYNHRLYKDGLRHYKKPIGASIDADSKSSSLSIKTYFNKLIFDLTLQNINLNMNDSELNYWSNQSYRFNQADFKISKMIKNYYVELVLVSRNKEILDYKKNDLIINLEYRF